MFVQLGEKGPAEDAAPSAVGMLLECHARIRKFAGMAVRLAQASGVPATELSQAAEAVHRYFTVALPLHVADEDQTLTPLVSRLGGPSELQEHLAQMGREHGPIEAVLEELVPRWATLVREGRMPERSMSPESARLEQLLHAHLQHEEEEIFPRLGQVLTAAAQQEFLEAIRARRQVR